MYEWVTLLQSRKWHDIVNRIYFSKKKKKSKLKGKKKKGRKKEEKKEKKYTLLDYTDEQMPS